VTTTRAIKSRVSGGTAPLFLEEIENLWAGNPLEGVRFKADLAMQTRHLPEGARVKLNVAPAPK
jgi:hypothetical protein